MTDKFRDQRRQQFLTQEFYKSFDASLEKSRLFWATHDPEADSPAEAESLKTSLFARDRLIQWILQYTAGEEIIRLRVTFEEVIKSFETYQYALAAYEHIPNVSPLGMGRIDDYEICMQLIGLCYLLHRRDLLPRIAKLQDPGYAGRDAVYEEILAYSLPNRFDTNAMLHINLYDHLVQMMYADEDDKALAALNNYLKAWYPSFKYAPWHDGHTRINGANGDYFGYWAFEAGALSYLTRLDDSSVHHITYPKDLVKFAREYKSSDLLDHHAGHLRCEAGQPCPSTGWWLSPAAESSRRYFQNGEIMPDLGGDYGATIWQWDADQGA